MCAWDQIQFLCYQNSCALPPLNYGATLAPAYFPYKATKLRPSRSLLQSPKRGLSAFPLPHTPFPPLLTPLRQPANSSIAGNPPEARQKHMTPPFTLYLSYLVLMTSHPP